MASPHTEQVSKLIDRFDEAVRQSIRVIRPNNQDAAVEDIVNMVGDIARAANQNPRNFFMSLLVDMDFQLSTYFLGEGSTEFMVFGSTRLVITSGNRQATGQDTPEIQVHTPAQQRQVGNVQVYNVPRVDLTVEQFGNLYDTLMMTFVTMNFANTTPEEYEEGVRVVAEQLQNYERVSPDDTPEGEVIRDIYNSRNALANGITGAFATPSRVVRRGNVRTPPDLDTLQGQRRDDSLFPLPGGGSEEETVNSPITPQHQQQQTDNTPRSVVGEASPYFVIANNGLENNVTPVQIFESILESPTTPYVLEANEDGEENGRVDEINIDTVRQDANMVAAREALQHIEEFFDDDELEDLYATSPMTTATVGINGTSTAGLLVTPERQVSQVRQRTPTLRLVVSQAENSEEQVRETARRNLLPAFTGGSRVAPAPQAGSGGGGGVGRGDRGGGGVGGGIGGGNAPHLGDIQNLRDTHGGLDEALDFDDHPAHDQNIGDMEDLPGNADQRNRFMEGLEAEVNAVFREGAKAVAGITAGAVGVVKGGQALYHHLIHGEIQNTGQVENAIGKVARKLKEDLQQQFAQKDPAKLRNPQAAKFTKPNAPKKTRTGVPNDEYKGTVLESLPEESTSYEDHSHEEEFDHTLAVNPSGKVARHHPRESDDMASLHSRIHTEGKYGSGGGGENNDPGPSPTPSPSPSPQNEGKS